MYDGDDRRKMNPELEQIKGRIDLLSQSINNLIEVNNASHKTFLDEVTKHSQTLYGNGKPGLTTSISSLKDALNAHQLWDRILFCGIGGVLVVILTKLR